MNYLRSRADVDGERIGALGISMGGTIALYGAPECQPIKAILAGPAVQRAGRSTTTSRSTSSAPLGSRCSSGRSSCCTGSAKRRRRAPRTRATPAKHLNGTIVKYVQGTGDQLGHDGRRASHARRARRTLDGPVVHFPSSGRYDGYRYVSAETEAIVDFFQRTL